MMLPERSPLEAVEALFEELVTDYPREQPQRELQAAKVLLLVALKHVRNAGGPQWQALLDEYVGAAKYEPDRLDRMLAGNRRPAGRH
jgi:hypothetical protein